MYIQTRIQNGRKEGAASEERERVGVSLDGERGEGGGGEGTPAEMRCEFFSRVTDIQSKHGPSLPRGRPRASLLESGQFMFSEDKADSYAFGGSERKIANL